MKINLPNNSESGIDPQDPLTGVFVAAKAVSKKVSLSVEEKAEGLAKLQEFMKTAPIVSPRAIPSPFSFSTFNIFQKKYGMVFAVFAIMLIAGGSTVFAAKGALPGDILYPVKIHFNEKIESFAALNTKDAAQVAVLHAENRLKEIETLKADGKLNDDNQKEAETHFQENSNDVAQNVEELKVQGDATSAASLESDFEGILTTHHATVLGLSHKNGNSDEGFVRAAAATQTRQTRMSKKQKQDASEATATEVQSADAHKNDANDASNTNDANDGAQQNKTTSSDEHVDLKTELDLSVPKHIEGRGKVDLGL